MQPTNQVNQPNQPTNQDGLVMASLASPGRLASINVLYCMYNTVQYSTVLYKYTRQAEAKQRPRIGPWSGVREGEGRFSHDAMTDVDKVLGGAAGNRQKGTGN